MNVDRKHMRTEKPRGVFIFLDESLFRVLGLQFVFRCKHIFRLQNTLKIPNRRHFDCVTSLTSRVDPLCPPEVLTLPFSLLAEQASTRTHFLLVQVHGSHFQTNMLAHFLWKRTKCFCFCNSSRETEHSVVFRR